MNRKREIANDLWGIVQKVYQIHSDKQSEKQEELITKIVDYIDENLSTRRKRKESKEIPCSSESDK